MLPIERFITVACLVGFTVSPSWAATLTEVSFKSNGGVFINDTIVDGLTAPLAFTNTTDLSQPFLNAPDSTVSLGYGNYYAISFLGFGAHQGAGTVSFLSDGAPFSQAVTFPDPAAASSNFATFALPGGDSVTISATGLSADRISIFVDGGGLSPGAGVDAFYLFSFTAGGSSAVPEPATAVLCGFGALILGGWRRKR